MRLLQRVRTGSTERRARSEPRASGVRLQAHPGVLHEAREAAGVAEAGLCLVSMDVERSVPGDASAIRERSQPGMELTVLTAVSHPETSQIDRDLDDVRSQSAGYCSARVFDSTQDHHRFCSHGSVRS